MEKEFFWKSFNLAIELSIAGSFIYNGLRAFDELQTFYYTEEIFEFLYNISVGIERLEKIAIILIEHDNVKNQEKFKKSLITHNHLELLSRIKKKHKLKLGKQHNRFLQLLTEFYNNTRYSRYNFNEVYFYNKEKQAILNYISKELGIQLEETSKNNYRIKKFIGKIIGKIATELYEIIYNEAHRLNIYTYELRINSKAAKIFLRKEFDFLKETVLWKELLIYLMNTREDIGIVNFIKNIQPLSFDPGLIPYYLTCFQNDVNKLEHLNELDILYDEDVVNKKERLEMLELIGDPYVYFDENYFDEEMI